MSRQHAAPVLVPASGEPVALAPLGLGPEGHGWSEAQVQLLIQAHPACLPVAEIDPLFASPVPICTELNTTAGPIDNLLVTASGLPVLVECKLWRNPQARREVVGQILDYAKELSRWSSSDLQREVRRRLGRDDDPVLELVRAAGHEVEEIAFNDALTHNLRRGRFLLLIVGDGIREGVEAIAEYLQAHAGLHFTLGLVELPIHALPDGGRIVTPRVLARTELITRTVVETPPGLRVDEPGETDGDTGAALSNPNGLLDPLDRLTFWTEFVDGLTLDDAEQPRPRPGRKGDITATLPVPGGYAWITVYRSVASWNVGVFLSYTRDSIGARVVARVVEDWPVIKLELGGTAELFRDKLGRDLIQDKLRTGPWSDPVHRATALEWLRGRLNDFVNVLRPRVRAAVAELGG